MAPTRRTGRCSKATGGVIGETWPMATVGEDGSGGHWRPSVAGAGGATKRFVKGSVRPWTRVALGDADCWRLGGKRWGPSGWAPSACTLEPPNTTVEATATCIEPGPPPNGGGTERPPQGTGVRERPGGCTVGVRVPLARRASMARRRSATMLPPPSTSDWKRAPDGGAAHASMPCLGVNGMSPLLKASWEPVARQGPLRSETLLERAGPACH